MKTKVQIVNFGAGVNSTALIIEMVNRKMPIDYVIFADTRSEMPETYKHLEVMKKWCEDKVLKFIIVESIYKKPLTDYYYEHTTIPFRKFRDCTDKFKRQPINKFLKQFKERGVVQHIGIAIDESRRCKQGDKKWIENKFLLCEWKYDREKCIEIIKKAGIEVPIKSGCYMCPFQPYKSWERLYKNHKELWEKARILEENGRSYPRNYLPFQTTLAEYERKFKGQRTLTELRVFEVCDGYCMT